MEFKDEDTQSTIIYDSDRFAMIILADDNGEKSGFATRFDPEMLEGDEDEETPESSGLDAYKLIYLFRECERNDNGIRAQ